MNYLMTIYNMFKLSIYAFLISTEKGSLHMETASCILPDSRLSLEAKTEPSVAKAKNHFGGETPHMRKQLC